MLPVYGVFLDAFADTTALIPNYNRDTFRKARQLMASCRAVSYGKIFVPQLLRDRANPFLSPFP